MADLVRGDTVQLRSGGPIMTVTEINHRVDGGSKVWVCWFDNGKKVTDSFPAEALDKAQTSTGFSAELL